MKREPDLPINLHCVFTVSNFALHSVGEISLLQINVYILGSILTFSPSIQIVIVYINITFGTILLMYL